MRVHTQPKFIGMFGLVRKLDDQIMLEKYLTTKWVTFQNFEKFRQVIVGNVLLSVALINTFSMKLEWISWSLILIKYSPNLCIQPWFIGFSDKSYLNNLLPRCNSWKHRYPACYQNAIFDLKSLISSSQISSYPANI